MHTQQSSDTKISASRQQIGEENVLIRTGNLLFEGSGRITFILYWEIRVERQC